MEGQESKGDIIGGKERMNMIVAIVVTAIAVLAIPTAIYLNISQQCWEWGYNLNNAAVWGSVNAAYDQCMSKNWIAYGWEFPQLIKIDPPSVGNP
jgi:hypothetical protein